MYHNEPLAYTFLGLSLACSLFSIFRLRVKSWWRRRHSISLIKKTGR